MNTALRERLMQFQHAFQHERGRLVEAQLQQSLMRAFVAKSVLGLTQTSDLVERLNADVALRRLCGFDLRQITRLKRQSAGMRVSAMLADLSTACDVGTKRNSQGFQSRWVGDKLHLDVADGMIPVTALLTSASVHDAQVAIPLATLSAQRVTNGYGLMDAAYCSPIIRQYSEQLGHVPLIDHNPRGGEKRVFAPHQAQRFKERSTVEQVNARLKDAFGLSRVNVRGHAKVMTHMMFAVLALRADQLLRWAT